MTFMMILTAGTGEFLGARKPKSRRMCLEFEGTVEICVCLFRVFLCPVVGYLYLPFVGCWWMLVSMLVFGSLDVPYALCTRLGLCLPIFCCLDLLLCKVTTVNRLGPDAEVWVTTPATAITDYQ